MGGLWRFASATLRERIETGAFELADDTIAATDRHHERVPDAQPWVIRIGHRTVHKSLGIKIIRSDRL
jgi:hypothetical protein